MRTLAPGSAAVAWRTELLAGFQVFLIAMPLCLGIAMASGFPPVAGLVAAIVGGLVVSRLSGSHVTINGPAAGLIVVILAGIERLGHGDPIAGYKLTLAAIVCAGILQMLFGFLRIGKLAAFFPSAVVHGMLSAIGIIIVAKQFPVMLGAKPQAQTILGLIGAIPRTVLAADPAVAAIGVTSLGILVAYRFLPAAWRRLAPAPIVVAAVGAAIAQVAHMQTGLVTLPANVFGDLALPDFSRLYTWDFAAVVFSIGAVAGIETLLSASAVDKLDPAQRKTDLNRDLFAVGLGSTISALLGGLPMIAEIVRSSANVAAGARSQWSNFFHGAFLLIAILILPDLIRCIPLASLAALLVFTGYRLASPAEIAKMRRLGNDQLALFLVTCVGVIGTDILIGVTLGVATKIALHVLRRVSLRQLVRCDYRLERRGEEQRLVVAGPVVFSNLIALAGALEQLPRPACAVVDLTAASFIDHTAMEFLDGVKREFATAGGSLLVVQSDGHVGVTDHPLAARRLGPSLGGVG